MKIFFKKEKNTIFTVIIGLIFIAVLLALPTGYEDTLLYKDAERASVTVLDVDNSNIKTSGLIKSGEQSCMLHVNDGIFKNKEITGVNFLSGSAEKDKIYESGDKALVTISHDGSNITNTVMSDHYRLDKEIILVALFTIFLIFFAGKNGIQAVFSFLITILTIWKILVPAYLKGYSPVWIGILITVLLTFIIIFFVYGIDKRTICAVLGSLLGTITTCIIGMIFTDLFKLNGAVMTGSESLIYSGYQNLDLKAIYMSSIFIGASGAMMDLAVDITSAVYEVIKKKPDISCTEAIECGMNVGRAAMGTMTTTLLLAYSGGYVTQLMVFMAQGTPISHILNYKYVASELLDTLVGSFGLVTVAPFTAMVCGVLLTKSLNKLILQLKG